MIPTVCKISTICRSLIMSSVIYYGFINTMNDMSYTAPQFSDVWAAWSGMCTWLLVGEWLRLGLLPPLPRERVLGILSDMCFSTHLSKHSTDSVLGSLE